MVNYYWLNAMRYIPINEHIWEVQNGMQIFSFNCKRSNMREREIQRYSRRLNIPVHVYGLMKMKIWSNITCGRSLVSRSYLFCKCMREWNRSAICWCSFWWYKYLPDNCRRLSSWGWCKISYFDNLKLMKWSDLYFGNISTFWRRTLPTFSHLRRSKRMRLYILDG